MLWEQEISAFSSSVTRTNFLGTTPYWHMAAIMQAANETDPKIKKIAKKLFNKIKDKNAKELAKQYISL